MFLNLFARIAREYAYKPALVFEGKSISYTELDHESSRIAYTLMANGIGHGDIVVIRLPRCREAVAAILGVMKSGAAVCVTEEGYPQERIDFVIRDTYSKVVIDFNWLEQLPAEPQPVSFPELQKDDPAIVVYTSGSTGNPKGVVNSHRALSMAIRGNTLDRTEHDTFLSVASFSFIAVALEIFTPLSMGGTIHIAGENLRKDAQALVDYVRQHGITTSFSPPQMARIILPQLEDQLSSMVIGSDRVTNIYSDKVHLHNVYGCSETCGPLVSFQIDRAYPDITPIGRPYAGSCVYILDDENNLLPDGEKGEICLSGQVALGYLNLPELTAERFIPNPWSKGEDDRILFKTNDIGRINKDGQLEYVQRKDWMIKVRGFRVEPGEIEATIVRLTSADQAVVKGFENANGETSLFCVYTAREPLTPESITEAIRGFLPAYMMPAFLKQVDALPVNANGKVDRKNIMPPNAAKFRSAYQAPENDREAAICAAFQRVLGIDRVGTLDDFNLIGGDSISAAKVQAELEGMNLSASDILSLGTPQKLAASVKSGLSKAKKRDCWPLTFAERQMVVEQGMNPESTSYNINFLAIEIEGEFDADRLEQALNAMAERHTALRSIYPMEKGEYVHRILDELHIPVVRRSCAREDVQGIIEAENRPFDLAKAPLVRCEVFEHAPKLRTLHFCFHHIIMDGSGWPIFADELFRLYRGETLSEQVLNYQDYAVWQAKNVDLQRQEAFFKEMFADGVPENEMPAHVKRPSVLPEADKDIVTALPKAPIKEAAERLGVTQYGFLLSVLGMTLAKYCGSEDVVVGTAMSGRTLKEQEKMIGMFVNTLPVRMKPAGDILFKDYLLKTAQIIRGVQANQTYPFEKLVPMLAPERNASRSPVFDVIFNYLQEQPLPEIEGAKAAYIPIKGQALQMDLVLEAIHEGSNFKFKLSYSRQLYDETIVRNFMEQFIITLQRCCDDSDNRMLADLAELPDSQRRQILCDFPGKTVEGWGGRTVISLFKEQVAKTPDNAAVVFRKETLSYRQLDKVTDRLAVHLKKMGAGRGSVVGIMVNRSLMMPIGALAVLKTGAAYMPLDPGYPADRLRYMLQDANVKTLICDSDLLDRVPEYSGSIVDSAIMDTLPAVEAPEDISRPEDLFILLYTSGTTGKPKGVMLTNANIVNYLHFYADSYQLSESDNITAYASFGFDAHMLDLYPTLLRGACLHILPEEMRLDLPGIRRYFDENKITVAFMTTQLGRQFAESMRAPTLRALSVGGEALVPLEPPEYALFNLYGPAECAIACTRQQVDKLYDRVPIGKAVYNTALYVADGRGRLAPVGVLGELYISGVQVADGYMNRPDLTAEKFIANPFTDDPLYARVYKSGDVVCFLPDGAIDFVGRRDFQVKIRGFRIELTEIEGRIRAFDGIKDAAVIAQDDAGGGKRVVAYVVSDTPVDIKAMNAFIENELPSYMVPSATMQIERIPLNQNGKVNRRELPRIQLQAEEIVAPRNEEEKAIFDAVASVLKHEDFGVTTDLMYAGLNSLSAIKATALITENTGKNLRTADLMREKTIEKIALLLADSGDYQIKTFDKQAYYPLTQNQMGLYFACVKDPGTLVYNIPVELSFGNDVEPEKLHSAILRVIEAHPYIKTRFSVRDNEPVQLRMDDAQVEIPVITCTTEEYAVRRADFVRPFSFFEGALFRMEICVLPDDGVKLLGDFHHMVFDGGSLDIFLHDLAAAYEGARIAAETFTSFDLALLEQEKTHGSAWAEDKAFFHHRLGDGEGATVFPTDKKSDSPGAPQSVYATIAKSSVKQAIKGMGVTASNLFLAATMLVSGRFASAKNVRIAAISNGREGAHVQRNFGMLVKTLPMVMTIDPVVTAAAYMDGVQQEMNDVLAHQAYSYLQAASDYGYNAQMLYAYQGGVVSHYKIGDTPVAMRPLGLNSAKFPLSVNIQENDMDFIVEVEYDDAVYNASTMHTLASCIAHIAGMLVRNGDTPVGSLSICNKEQLALVNSFSAQLPAKPVGGLHQLFERWAGHTPDAHALIASDATLSFAELNRRANSLAHSLLALGVKHEDRVAFTLERDSRILVSMLGIIKAGCAYIPVDPDYPRERVEHVLEDSKARFILTDGPSTLKNSLDVNELLKNENTLNPNLPVRQEQLCYIIYTSGSTGKPKGVMLTHGGIINYVLDDEQNRHVRALVENRCTMCSVTTVSFDMFLKEAFTTLMNGLTLVLADDEEAKNPDKLAALFARTGANAFNATPSRMLQYMELPAMKEALAECRVIMAGGEGYPPALYRKLREVTNAVLINTYGPTEITVSSNGKLLNSEAVTIGAPLRGVVEQVMDIYGQPLPAGFIGELWIAGYGVARGYFGNPEMTAERFVEYNGLRWYKTGDLAKWTDHGEIIVLGRNDGQIKLRGLRIELGEIENNLNAVPDVRSCAVVVRKLHGQEHLCAYYTATRELPAEELREVLLKTLTKYMVPTAYLQLDEMPMTPNGKIDRKRFPDAKLMQRQEYEAPINEVEQIYCDIFAEILHLERVGATDNFFDLGGTSLLVTQVTIDAAQKGIQLSYGDIFANPTPRELAAIRSNAEQSLEKDEISDYDYAPIHALLEENTIEALKGGKLRALGNVCITGANGFLGIHVLRAYLQMEKGTAFCVVRGRKNLSAEKRLKTMLSYYFGGALIKINGKPFLDAMDELFSNRIVVIDGSIIDDSLYQKLAQLPIDTYINCAANVKHFSSGTDIEDVNYGGVKMALDFCRQTKCRFVQVSTTSIAGMSINGMPDEKLLLSERMLYFSQDLSNKYARSKFLAERAVLESALDGVDVKIMRVGNLMARDTDGEFQINFATNNFLGRLKAYSLIGKISYEAMGMNTEFAPIGFTAVAVLLLAKTPEKCRVFHPYNDHHIFLGDAIDVMRRRGMDIQPCETEEYVRCFGEAMRDSAKARYLNSLIAYNEHGKRIMPIKSINSYTSQVLLRQGFKWPITSDAYLDRFFAMMEGLGFFDHDFEIR